MIRISDDDEVAPLLSRRLISLFEITPLVEQLLQNESL